MSIIIHSINNSANNELPCGYNEKDFFDGEVRSSDNSPIADNKHKLIVSRVAVREIFDFIEWDRGKRSDTQNEQGGIIIGKRYYDSEKDLHFAVVSKAIPAVNAIGTPGFLDITSECWYQMHMLKDEYNSASGENAIILGWFHTHPNGLPCFMSGVDRNTQNLYFAEENTYAVVINPQRHLMKAFRSNNCYPAQAFFIMD